MVASSSSAGRVNIYLYYDTNGVHVYLSYYFSLDSVQYKEYKQK